MIHSNQRVVAYMYLPYYLMGSKPHLIDCLHIVPDTSVWMLIWCDNFFCACRWQARKAFTARFLAERISFVTAYKQVRANKSFQLLLYSCLHTHIRMYIHTWIFVIFYKWLTKLKFHRTHTLCALSIISIDCTCSDIVGLHCSCNGMLASRQAVTLCIHIALHCM